MSTRSAVARSIAEMKRIARKAKEYVYSIEFYVLQPLEPKYQRPGTYYSRYNHNPTLTENP